jgi:hypothetical protein
MKRSFSLLTLGLAIACLLVTCTVTIAGIGSHSGSGEEWADDENAMTSAEAQAFKRACSCFGLGRYFYDFTEMWVERVQRDLPCRRRNRCGRYCVAVAERPQLAAFCDDCWRSDLRIGHPAAHRILHRARSGGGLRYLCRHHWCSKQFSVS